MRNALKILFSLLLLILGVGYGPSTQAQENNQTILATLVLDGVGLVVRFEPATAPLFCEGGSECGSAMGTLTQVMPIPTGGFATVFEITICKGISCVTTHNTLFIDDFIPLISPVLRDAAEQLILEGALPPIPLEMFIASSAAMTQHDPIACEDVTGEFKEPGCAGNLKLDYRCLNFLNPMTGQVIVFSGTFIISTID